MQAPGECDAGGVTSETGERQPWKRSTLTCCFISDTIRVVCIVGNVGRSGVGRPRVHDGSLHVHEGREGRHVLATESQARRKRLLPRLRTGGHLIVQVDHESGVQ